MGPTNEALLIYRHLQQPEDEKILSELRVWLEQNPQHNAILEHYRAIWNASPDAAVFIEMDLDAVTTRFRQKLPASAKVFRFPYLKTAAAAVLLLAGGLWYWSSQRTSTLYLHKTTTNAIDSLVLDDGSMIVLNKHSSIRYSDLREVELEYGEAFFEVAPLARRPFAAYAGEVKVSVLGTSFQLAADKHAVNLLVVSGAVNFGLRKSERRLKVSAGQAAVHLKGDTAVQYKNPDYSAIAWRTGELHFSDTPMESVCRSLSDHYGVVVVMEDKHRGQLRLNANFDNLTLDEILQTLNALYDYQYEKKGDTIYIR